MGNREATSERLESHSIIVKTEIHGGSVDRSTSSSCFFSSLRLAGIIYNWLILNVGILGVGVRGLEI